MKNNLVTWLFGYVMRVSDRGNPKTVSKLKPQNYYR